MYWTKIISAEISSAAPELFQLSMTGDKQNLVGTIVEGKSRLHFKKCCGYAAGFGIAINGSMPTFRQTIREEGLWFWQTILSEKFPSTLFPFSSPSYPLPFQLQ